MKRNILKFLAGSPVQSGGGLPSVCTSGRVQSDRHGSAHGFIEKPLSRDGSGPSRGDCHRKTGFQTQQRVPMHSSVERETLACICVIAADELFHVLRDQVHFDIYAIAKLPRMQVRHLISMWNDRN